MSCEQRTDPYIHERRFEQNPNRLSVFWRRLLRWQLRMVEDTNHPSTFLLDLLAVNTSSCIACLSHKIRSSAPGNWLAGALLGKPVSSKDYIYYMSPRGYPKGLPAEVCDQNIPWNASNGDPNFHFISWLVRSQPVIVRKNPGFPPPSRVNPRFELKPDKFVGFRSLGYI